MLDFSKKCYYQCNFLGGTMFKMCVFCPCLLIWTSQKRRDVFMPPRRNVWGYFLLKPFCPLRSCLKVGAEKTLLGVTVFLLNFMAYLSFVSGTLE